MLAELPSRKPRLFSAVKPSGRLHLGNYLGAVRNWIALQDRYQCVFGIVDYHAITIPQKPQDLARNSWDMVLDLLALGVDPKKSLLVMQSDVPAHTALGWIFNTITPVSWLDRLPPYREQIAKNPQHNQMGILGYPVLMAADILLYKAEAVPVGEDQLPHIDLTNEIAKKFNRLFGKTFEPVKALLTPGERIMSLQDPKKKMAKSGGDTISLADSPDEIREKIKKAVTDSGKDVAYSPGAKPALSNLLTIHKELSGKDFKDLAAMYGTKGYAGFKQDLGELIVEHLSSFRKRRRELEQDPSYARRVLQESKERAGSIAQHVLDEVMTKMGFLRMR